MPLGVNWQCRGYYCINSSAKENSQEATRGSFFQFFQNLYNQITFIKLNHLPFEKSSVFLGKDVRGWNINKMENESLQLSGLNLNVNAPTFVPNINAAAFVPTFLARPEPTACEAQTLPPKPAMDTAG